MNNQKSLYNFKEIMKPFWQSGIMYNESVLMLSEGGGAPAAPLLFKPEKILSVKNSYLDTEYAEGEDWVFEDGVLKLMADSKAVYMTTEEMYPTVAEEGRTFPRAGGGYILFAEKHFFHDYQLAVTYLHSSKGWTGPEPVFEGERLRETMDKLEAGLPVKIILFGDSISVGANASSITGAPPFQPNWGTLFVERLRRTFPSEITFLNPSKGGKSSSWGLKNVEELVSVQRPDLVLLAFGMNDGTGRVSPQSFEKNIREMMENIRKHNKKAEFILVATMLPNKLAAIPGQPELSFWGEQENYKELLALLSGAGAAVADMTSVHRELLKYKRYCDMTGNNVNHPNDFLGRWYAQVVSALMIKE